MHYDVIVVGAGLAGLAAAERLTRAGLTVCLLEARDRVGGRVWTRTDASTSHPIEMGAEWLGASGQMRKLLRKERAEVRAATGEFLVRQPDGQAVNDSTQATSDDLVEYLTEMIGDGADRSLHTALNEFAVDAKWRDARLALTGYVQGFHAADPATLSVKWLNVVERNEPADASQFRALSGLATAVNALYASIGSTHELHLHTVVREIRWRHAEVEVLAERTGESHVFKAKAIVVTLPLGVLKVGTDEPFAVKFSPALTSKREALSTLGMGHVIKSVFVFDEPIWQRDAMITDALFIQDMSQRIPTWWTTSPTDAPVMVGWVGGPPVDGFADVTDEELMDYATDSLAGVLRISRAEIDRHVRNVYTHNWNNDPFSRGAYSYVKSGGIDAFRALREPVSDTLFFAGEATRGGGHNATMEGALQSGYRAAESLLDRSTNWRR